ncbi:ABC transporter ATP-binding protein [Flavimobilis marinus]|uniref:Monosaccharide ABC transporter ATP-binding protein, CUT2 family n=1 Tax=Flavimobilis marinus TaxID=285351 RepID=A0A1I2CRC0_9MICO|nr:sugar ABC transporter ATP-binding protein [Flavimobilis marinus]GHG47112.1 ABC transporter ATP-binding protein [Flavimobilis marinus]SFE70722.1 monosaccharide ABC transporter ATP-binding protein, CUT2 family [Flavimobilis marinus]
MAPTTEPTGTPVVQMTGITIQFPGVKALDDVDFRLFPGEVHALMGENGAGKSTLIKALTGVYAIDAGEIRVADRTHRFSGPDEAQAAGISTVYQEVNLCANLSVAENVMLGHEPRTGPFISWRKMRAQAAEYLARLHLDIDPASLLSAHSIAVQQLCAIARSTVVEAKVLILDEPTSSLQKAEVDELFEVIRELRERGVAILFVSHFLEQVYEISDRMTILRNGRLVAEHRTADLPRRELISLMVGREGAELDAIEDGVQSAHRERPADVVPALAAVGLGRDGSVEAFDLDVYPGEIVGLAGLLGSGRTETVRLLCGADRPERGELRLAGETVKISDPLDALHKRIAFSSEDRKKEGIVGDLTVRENIALAMQTMRGVWKPLPRKELDEVVAKYMTALKISPADPGMLVKNLSGGNQQKVLLARWLATAPRILILDEPTRGIDIGAKADIQKLVTDLAADGMSVLFISSEFDEVLRVSQRIDILRDRRLVRTIANGPEVTQDTLLAAIAAKGEVA